MKEELLTLYAVFKTQPNGDHVLSGFWSGEGLNKKLVLGVSVKKEVIEMVFERIAPGNNKRIVKFIEVKE